MRLMLFVESVDDDVDDDASLSLRRCFRRGMEAELDLEEEGGYALLLTLLRLLLRSRLEWTILVGTSHHHCLVAEILIVGR
jgi:hypothetical protein